ncbi:hypothetical protein [uncultured Chitinophaga sp.]|uniref:hypothetical protein n=1 Tax=uncultured Chitinophaga sp. TaxID=339340 RepID=UPI0026012B69|nr:hypothetical protein [uncultured Chitinophaga sp.]
MNKYVAVDNISEELSVRRLFGITLWNRLEARPRADNFDRALRAEVRDALWMLSKQWQMGEFLGDDAGSPVFSKMYMTKTRLTKFAPGGHDAEFFDDTVPLEAKVEKRAIPFESQTTMLSLDLRLLMGRQWLKMIKSSVNATVLSEYINHYKIPLPDAANKDDAPITAHKEAWQQLNAVAGRCMDGAAFYFRVKGAINLAHDGIPSLPAAQQPDIEAIATRFITWFENLYYQPGVDGNDAWKPQQLEYQFACSAPVQGAEKVLTADEYYQGHLDWYNLDIDPSQKVLGEVTGDVPADIEDPLKFSFIPVPVNFDGMPNTRWWSFEDGRTNFGNITPKTTDAGKLLFIEFSLVYANDWFLLPVTLPAGSIASVKGLSVTNVFGERLWIEPAGKGLDDAWNKWSMYTLSTKGNNGEATDTSLLVLPTVSKIQEGAPLEEIHFIRDETANMVWGIETVVPLATGWDKNGNEAARELRNRYQQLFDKAVEDNTEVPANPVYHADLRYEVMNTVPENWIPFIPARIDGSNRSIRLQRAAMPRIIKGKEGAPDKTEPRCSLLRDGLDSGGHYFINEEEITRAGTQVYSTYQRARWYNGKVVTWLGVRKETGRGEGSSRLEFDQARAVKKNTP